MNQLPSKKEVAEMLLQNAPSVFLHLDPRRDRVVVPAQFRHQPHLTLEIGLNMPVPIRDLDVSDDGISCTLSFNRSPFWCRLPWSSMFAIVSVDHRGMVWPEDVPSELADRVSKSPSKPAMQAVTGGASETPPDQPAAKSPAPEPAPAQSNGPETDKPKRKLPPYLRVVK